MEINIDMKQKDDLGGFSWIEQKQMNKTEYRIVGDGTHRYLQYAKHHKFLLWSWISWEYIPYPKDWRCSPLLYTYHVSTYNQGINLKEFALKYPDIKTYFKTEYLQLKESTEKEYKSFLKEVKSNEDHIEYLK